MSKVVKQLKETAAGSILISDQAASVWKVHVISTSVSGGSVCVCVCVCFYTPIDFQELLAKHKTGFHQDQISVKIRSIFAQVTWQQVSFSFSLLYVMRPLDLCASYISPPRKYIFLYAIKLICA